MKAHIDALLTAHLAPSLDAAPPRLAKAMRYAVFSGGGRLRPRLTLLVSRALGAPHHDMAQAAAVAVELVHTASLVHDDLPAFDDASVRRGRSTVHRRFDEPTAVLVGDGLLAAAFEVLSAAALAQPAIGCRLISCLARAVGPSRGIVAGQAWEMETDVNIDQYHRLKTGALFGAALGMGALCAGEAPQTWLEVGDALGQAYQAADDLSDQLGAVGKPSGQDERRARPNLALARGVEEARARVFQLVARACALVPLEEDGHALRAMIDQTARRLMPDSLVEVRPCA